VNPGPTSAFLIVTGRKTCYRLIVQLSFAYFSMQAQFDDYTMMDPIRLPHEPTEVKMVVAVGACYEGTGHVYRIT
jgi:hypothetical protein